MQHLLAILLSIASPPNPQTNVPIMYDGQIICSSVLIDPTHVVTAAHCLQTSVVMDLMCGSVKTPGLVIRFDKENDLIEFELVEPCGQPVSSVAQVNPARGATVYSLGCPGGHCGRIAQGVVSAYDTSSDHQVLVSTAQAFFGSSGGGLFNDAGEVVGICSQVAPLEGNGIQVLYNLYIPASSINRFLATPAIY